MKKLFSLVFSLFFLLSAPVANARVSDTDRLKSIVKIFLFDKEREEYRSLGSGLILGNEKVLTAFHLVSPMARDPERFEAHICVTRFSSEQPLCTFFSYHVTRYNEEYDLALLSLDAGYDEDTDAPLDWAEYSQKYIVTEFTEANDFLSTYGTDKVTLGEKLEILGYPIIGGETITLTTGVVSGTTVDEIDNVKKTTAIKTDAALSGGVSGAPVFNTQNQLVGIALSVFTDGEGEIGHIVSVPAIRFFTRLKSQVDGEICYDYKNGYKKEGKCFCRKGTEWDAAELRCLVPEEEEDEDVRQDDSIDVSEKSEIRKRNSGEVPKVSAGTLSSLEENIEKQASPTFASRSIRSVILESLSECRVESLGNKITFRSCLRTRIKDFLKARTAEKRAAIKTCQKENPQQSSEERNVCVRKILFP